MFPIRKIVGSTDFSEASKVGLRIAIEVAEKFDAELILVHVNVKPIIAGTRTRSEVQSKVDMLVESLETVVRKHLNEIVAELIPQHLRCRVIFAEGQPADEITRLARREGADLIVMSTHGYSGVNRLLSGSVTERVVRTAHCPVLTIRPQEKDRPAG